MLKGVPVSPGIAVACAYCVDEVLALREPHHLDDALLSQEVKRFDNAIQAAGKDLDAIVTRVSCRSAKKRRPSSAAIDCCSTRRLFRSRRTS